MRNALRASAALLLGVGAVGFASTASASCADGTVIHRTTPQGEQDQSEAGGHFQQSDFEAGRSIVGMWSFKMTAGGNTVDFGYVQWHSDGTELMNSGGRAPASENFCMGVWRGAGSSRYHLVHYALSYDTSGTLNARVIIKEDVVVDPTGANYSGPFTLDVYDPNTNALLQHVAGDVTAQRIVAN